MSLFVELQKMKFCPLCRRKWHIMEEPGKDGRAYFYCLWCEISVWMQDAFLGKYEEFEPVHCFVCRRHQMRFFCRADGYCAWYCPDCKCKIEQVDPSKHETGKMKTVDDVKAEFRALTRDNKDDVVGDKKGGFFKGVEESKKELGLE